ncbi:hypothetical protein BV898_03362 [Hypsibius exemplaris]|uniref:C-type lectin domain-containing protein n=1 Tax=Hypsibius exemplaris TaxID=2072580 RepID=A0A1W0X4U6_HYPEX|nr:hypothetical protein BV898_03362 [Hypsibius exemplaris]
MVFGIVLLIGLAFGLIAKLNGALALEPVPVYKCPVGFTNDCGTCLNITLSDATWNVAKNNCISLGANLVTIRNADQNRCIIKYTSAGAFWIGLYSPATATPELDWEWRWINPMSVPQPADFLNFAPGSPDLYGDPDLEHERCSEIWSGKGIWNGKWNNMPCDISPYSFHDWAPFLTKSFGFICEADRHLVQPVVMCPPAALQPLRRVGSSTQLVTANQSPQLPTLLVGLFAGTGQTDDPGDILEQQRSRCRSSPCRHPLDLK